MADAAPEAAAAAPNPFQTTALVSVQALEAYTASSIAQSYWLRCCNPKCVHLFDVEEVDENLKFTPKECDSTVEIEMNGKLQTYYRLKADDRIYLANKAGEAALAANDDVRGHIICGECHDVGAHITAGGLCRCALDEVGEVAGRASRRATAANKPPTVADRNGSRLTALEELNRLSYQDHATIEKLKEAAADEARGREVDGGTAQRKAIIKERHQEALKRKMTAAESTNKVKFATSELEKTSEELEGATKKLEELKQGMSISEDSKEEDTSVDVTGENPHEAVDFFAACDRDLGKLRAAFPKHAARWYGPVPTEEVIQEQVKAVEEKQEAISNKEKEIEGLQEEAAAAKQEYALIEAEVTELEKQVVAEYDGNADAVPADDGAGQPKKGSKKKKVGEMNVEELAAYKEKSEADKKKRKLQAERKAEIVDMHEDLMKKANKYVKCKAQLAESKAKIEQLEAAFEAQESKLKRARTAATDFREGFVDWLGHTDDKPDGWDADDMLEKVQSHINNFVNAAKEQRAAEEEAAEAEQEA